MGRFAPTPCHVLKHAAGSLGASKVESRQGCVPLTRRHGSSERTVLASSVSSAGARPTSETDPAEAATTPDTADVRRPGGWAWNPFRVGVAVLLSVTMFWRVWTTSSWSWFQDDWVYLEKTQ